MGGCLPCGRRLGVPAARQLAGKMWTHGAAAADRWQDRAGDPTDPGEGTVSTDETPERPRPPARDQLAAGERAQTVARDHRRSPAHRAARAADTLREITTTTGYADAPE